MHPSRGMEDGPKRPQDIKYLLFLYKSEKIVLGITLLSTKMLRVVAMQLVYIFGGGGPNIFTFQYSSDIHSPASPPLRLMTTLTSVVFDLCDLLFLLPL